MTVSVRGVSRELLQTAQSAMCQDRYMVLVQELMSRGITHETASRAAREQLITEIAYMEHHNVN